MLAQENIYVERAFLGQKKLEDVRKAGGGDGVGSRELGWGSRLARAAVSQWVHYFSRQICVCVVSEALQ